MLRTGDEHSEQARSRVGQMLRGKYRIDRVLGIGGMASVYAATHRNGRRVAVKVLHASVSLNGDMRKRFLREGHAANAVNHPGAVVVIDDDIADDGAAFLVMELLEGHAIEHLWERNRQQLPPTMVLAIGYELCNVLEAAHRARIIHRDIKPANLFLTKDGQLKVLDFGLAQLRDGQAKLTATGMVFGTPAFMSPEQAAGRSSQVDAQSDIWALGATMFTLLSGRTVHEGETVQDMVMLAATKQARSLATVMPTADPRLVSLVDRAITINKQGRWPSADAMRKAIGATSLALHGEAIPKLMTPDELLRRPRGVTLRSNHPTEDALNDIDPPRARGVLADLSPSLDVSQNVPRLPKLNDSTAQKSDANDGDTDADMPSARDLPRIDMSQDLSDIAPPDSSDPAGETPSDAPTGQFRPQVVENIPKPAPTGYEAVDGVRARPPSDPDARPVKTPSRDVIEAMTLYQSPPRLKQARPISGRLPEPPASSNRDLGRPPSKPSYNEMMSADPPTLTNEAPLQLAEVRSVFASFRHAGVGRTLRAHPRIALLVLVMAGTVMALLGAVIVLVVH